MLSRRLAAVNPAMRAREETDVKALHSEQVAAFRRDGFLFPFAMLEEAERQTALADLDRYERWLGAPLSQQTDRRRMTQPYLFLPWFDALVRDPRVLDAIEDLIGPDILVWTGTFWIKEPGSATFAAWHQDNTYFGLEPSETVCAWLALTDASSEAGCMNVLSWHGAPRQLRHAPRRHAASINRAGQTVVEAFDDREAVAMELKAGEFSIHHGLCMHTSAPNHARHRRIGLGFNYMPPHVRPTTSVRMAAMLVRGEDRYGHFDLIEPPGGELDPASLALHEDAYARYAANYAEVVARREREWVGAA